MTTKHWRHSARECLRNILACLGILYIVDVVLAGPCRLETIAPSRNPCLAETVQIKQPYLSLELPDPKQGVERTDWDSIPCANLVPDCDLTDPTWGIPTILLSFGRSGSTVTWDTLAGLSRSSMNNTAKSSSSFQRSTEDLGKSMQATVKFFDTIPNHQHGKCALERILCTRQAESKQRILKESQTRNNTFLPGIYGSKWKPFLESFGHAKSRQALQWVAAQQGRIKVVYNRRNLLDVYLSKIKHEAMQLPAHCDQGNTACVEKHVAAEHSLVVPTDSRLEELEHWEHATNQTLALLNAYHVDMIQVQYEKLYYSDNLDEWNRLWSYIWDNDKQEPHVLTKTDVLAHLNYAATSASSHPDKMANYQEVKAVLQGTRFAKYLQ